MYLSRCIYSPETKKKKKKTLKTNIKFKKTVMKSTQCMKESSETYKIYFIFNCLYFVIYSFCFNLFSICHTFSHSYNWKSSNVLYVTVLRAQFEYIARKKKEEKFKNLMQFLFYAVYITYSWEFIRFILLFPWYK